MCMAPNYGCASSMAKKKCCTQLICIVNILFLMLALPASSPRRTGSSRWYPVSYAVAWWKRCGRCIGQPLQRNSPTRARKSPSRLPQSSRSGLLIFVYYFYFGYSMVNAVVTKMVPSIHLHDFFFASSWFYSLNTSIFVFVVNNINHDFWEKWNHLRDRWSSSLTFPE